MDWSDDSWRCCASGPLCLNGCGGSKREFGNCLVRERGPSGRGAAPPAGVPSIEAGLGLLGSAPGQNDTCPNLLFTGAGSACKALNTSLYSPVIMAQTTARSSLTINQLERLLEKRRSSLDALMRERSHLEKRLATIDSRIRSLSGGAPVAGSLGLTRGG